MSPDPTPGTTADPALTGRETPTVAPPTSGPADSSPDVPDCGPYTALTEIGRGGMGVVYRARDPELNRDLAVKVLRADPRDRPELARRFVEEAQVAGQLQHPGVVPVHDLGRCGDGRPFFTMKLVEGRTLAQLLKERPSPAHDLPRFLAVFEQVCQTVAYAHSRRVLHRDLKPSNVMVGAFGEVQVMDWGVAKVLTPLSGEPEATALASAVASGSPLNKEWSQPGALLGTPAYMPPEQAAGAADRLDERADVFGLGAVLCEVLTGEPPYTGRSGAEVYRRSRSADLADARERLGRCGADPELPRLALDCLAEQPADRPRDAGAVAGRVTAYQAGVRERLRAAELERAAAQARAEEARATAAAERRARRLTVGLAASVLTFALAGGLGWWAVERDRAARRAEAGQRRDVASITATEALAEVARAQGQGRWADARAALRRAADRLDDSESEELRAVVARAEADLAMIDALERARLSWSEHGQTDQYDDALADRAYAAAFDRYGLPVLTLGPDEAAARVRGSAIAETLITALDDWARHRPADRGRLRSVADRADRDPWRSRLRAAAAAADRAGLERLADDPGLRSQSAATQVLLADGLDARGAADRAEAVLRRALRDHPDDFWVYHQLGALLLNRAGPDGSEEAVGLYRSARALHPQSVGAHQNLAYALLGRRLFAEAESVSRAALGLDPDSFGAHVNLGVALARQGRREEALAAYRRAAALAPSHPGPHYNLGKDLAALGRDAEAESELRRALALSPESPGPWSQMARVLDRLGRRDEAVGAYEKALALAPEPADAHDLGLLLLDLGRLPAAETAFRRAIALQADFAEAQAGLGLVLLRQGKPAAAEAPLRQAVVLKPEAEQPLLNLGTALYRQRRYPEAEAEFRRAAVLNPRSALAYTNLGNAVMQQRRPAEAVAAYERAAALAPDEAEAHRNLGFALAELGRYDEAAAAHGRAAARQPAVWNHAYNLGNALREAGRLAEAEAAFRQAVARAPDQPEPRCNLGQVLRRRGRFAEAVEALRAGHEIGSRRPDWRYPSADWLAEAERLARLDADLPALLAGRPVAPDDAAALVEVCRARQRYAAAVRFAAPAARSDGACAAALASTGRGDGAGLPAKARAGLRRQALDWLRADLAAHATSRVYLQHARAEPDLAGLRDPDALARLPGPERDAWQKLWADLDAALRATAPPP